MRTVALLGLLLVSCADESEPIEVGDNVLVVAKPTEKHGIQVSCALDGPACKCETSECGAGAIEAAVAECNRLRSRPVVE